MHHAWIQGALESGIRAAREIHELPAIELKRLRPSVARPATRLQEFTGWLTAFGDAWESSDAEAAASLFAVGATLQQTPFDELVRGRRAIRDHFAAEFEQWPGVSFGAQVLGAGDTYGIAHWRVSSGARARDGVFVAALDDRGRCISLRQWWHETGAGLA